jgi:hypothetical protein
MNRYKALFFDADGAMELVSGLAGCHIRRS